VSISHVQLESFDIGGLVKELDHVHDCDPYYESSS